MKGARIAVGGDLEITLTVAANQKYEAMPVTDLPGVRFAIEVYRLRRT